jgi:hypothetical protein
MVWGAALYLRRRPLLAGVVLGVGACMKLVAVYVLFVIVVLEVLRWLDSRDAALRRVSRLGQTVVASAVSFFGVLAVLDRIARPYDDTAGKLIAGGPFAHLGHMLSYAAGQTSPNGPRGIASYPLGWLVDYKPIVYLNINPARPTAGLARVHPAVHFLGLISPPILLVGIPALVAAAVVAIRRRPAGDRELAILAIAWFAGAFVPFELLSLFWSRTSYIYYMVVVMPGVYMAAAWLAARFRRHPRLLGVWIVTVVLAAVIAYPLTPLP